MSNLSFKRITSSGNFIPEIEGLRFIAITGVVLYHLHLFFTGKMGHLYTNAFGYSFLKNIVVKGYIGVPLFFVISGFIVGMPFAKHYLKNQEPVNLKKYFFRRLTRLEPPYILVMTVLLFASIYVARNLTFAQGLESYFSSIFYQHNLIYGKDSYPLLNTVAWSLEIEIQFYILAPLLAYFFFEKSLLARRVLLSVIAILFFTLNHIVDLPFKSLINYFQYFVIGLLLTDLYISNSIILPKTKFDTFICSIFFVAIWYFDGYKLTSHIQVVLSQFIQLASIFLFYYYVLMHKCFKFLSLPLITSIGGMCYSIYLLHYPLISLFGNVILRHSFSKHSSINVSIYSVLLIGTISIISSAFFLLVERPCMDKDWYKKIFKHNNGNIVK